MNAADAHLASRTTLKVDASSSSPPPSMPPHETEQPVTGLETAAGGTIVKVVIEHAAPAGIAVVKSWLKGKTLMVVGPSRAGKSTFVNYLQFGIFQHEQETSKTYAPAHGPKFNLTVGSTKSLQVLVKTTVDLPGQYSEVQLANEVFDIRPHVLVVVLDASRDLHGSGGTADWMTGFFCVSISAGKAQSPGEIGYAR